MNKLYSFFFLVFIIVSCNKSDIAINKEMKIKKESKKEDLEQVKEIKKIKSNDLVYLFFDRSVFRPVKNRVATVKKEAEVINSDDYKVIIDWQVEGGRNIKLKNIKTNEMYTVFDGNKNGEIILLKRELFYYTFKIGDSIIKVKRNN